MILQPAPSIPLLLSSHHKNQKLGFIWGGFFLAACHLLLCYKVKASKKQQALLCTVSVTSVRSHKAKSLVKARQSTTHLFFSALQKVLQGCASCKIRLCHHLTCCKTALTDMPVLKFNYFKACHQYCQFYQHALRCMACSDFQLWSHMIKGESLLLLGVFQSSLKEKMFCLLKEQGHKIESTQKSPYL